MAAFGPCTALTGLSDGPHGLRVEFTDTAGNTTTAERTWTIDATGPETTIESGPAEGSTSAASEVTFAFGSPEAGATFECRLDGAAFAACPTPLKLTGLADGDHVFEVRARDAIGNVDASPVRRAFRVDTTGGGVVVQPPEKPVTPIEPVNPGQPAVVSAVLGKRFKAAGARTRILRLTVSKIAVGAKVRIVCKGRGCPIRSKTISPSSGVVNIRNVLKRRPLRAGTTLTITVSQPGMTSKVSA